MSVSIVYAETCKKLEKILDNHPDLYYKECGEVALLCAARYFKKEKVQVKEAVKLLRNMLNESFSSQKS